MSYRLEVEESRECIVFFFLCGKIKMVYLCVPLLLTISLILILDFIRTRTLSII
jgi:hypothetical protein